MRAPTQPPCLEDLRRHRQHGRRAAEDAELALQCLDKGKATGVVFYCLSRSSRADGILAPGSLRPEADISRP